jgi:hypothetical protein
MGRAVTRDKATLPSQKCTGRDLNPHVSSKLTRVAEAMGRARPEVGERDKGAGISIRASLPVGPDYLRDDFIQLHGVPPMGIVAEGGTGSNRCTSPAGRRVNLTRVMGR